MQGFLLDVSAATLLGLSKGELGLFLTKFGDGYTH